MLSNSTLYLAFLLVTSFLFWRIPREWRVPALILFGLLFYAYAGLGHLFLLLFLAGVTYWGAKKQNRFVFNVILLVLVLTLFKYVGAFVGIMAAGGYARSLFDVALPLGISFYTFELIHYLVEVYQGNIKKQDFKTFLAFILFFPTRTSGPIKRYGDFADQVNNLHFAPKHLYYGVGLLVLGYFQKIVIADPLVNFTSALQNPAGLEGSFDALTRLYAYSIRIYADFAGLTNIAMGSGLLFGVLVPRNFNYPYLKTNIALFWRNWHMSLSNWVRDYIYIPLGGSRQGELRTFLNLIIAMFIIGIWHGSTLNFAVWGLYHGAGIVFYRWWRQHFSDLIPSNYLTKALAVLVTFHFVTIGWGLFVTGSLEDSLLILTTLFNV